eukprot:TRINITY_DN16316_c0_g1_i4.p1 TRINITY_DN16316_c0_g1~~TRINITY_DN16316_c0_g1_i4.p1  ORF type:complete len:496 (+),score=99.15 TRINITY_DN16316_c0_g1_i4:72-1559(+)
MELAEASGLPAWPRADRALRSPPRELPPATAEEERGATRYRSPPPPRSAFYAADCQGLAEAAERWLRACADAASALAPPSPPPRTPSPAESNRGAQTNRGAQSDREEEQATCPVHMRFGDGDPVRRGLLLCGDGSLWALLCGGEGALWARVEVAGAARPQGGGGAPRAAGAAGGAPPVFAASSGGTFALRGGEHPSWELLAPPVPGGCAALCYSSRCGGTLVAASAARSSSASLLTLRPRSGGPAPAWTAVRLPPSAVVADCPDGPWRPAALAEDEVPLQPPVGLLCCCPGGVAYLEEGWGLRRAALGGGSRPQRLTAAAPLALAALPVWLHGGGGPSAGTDLLPIGGPVRRGGSLCCCLAAPIGERLWVWRVPAAAGAALFDQGAVAAPGAAEAARMPASALALPWCGGALVAALQGAAAAAARGSSAPPGVLLLCDGEVCVVAAKGVACAFDAGSGLWQAAAPPPPAAFCGDSAVVHTPQRPVLWSPYIGRVC